MCRHSTITLDQSVHAPRIARAWTTERLERWELSELPEPTVIMASELVSNAVVHAESSPVLSLAVVDGALEFGCRGQLPADRPLVAVAQTHHGDDPPPNRGRGLILVDSLADEWGQHGADDGKEVWFRLALDSWPYRFDCLCHTADHDHVPLGSGDVVHHNIGPWDW